MMKKDISANLFQKCLILCSKFLLNVLHNLSLTGFQTSPILEAFLATFGMLFSYLQIVPHMHDPTSICDPPWENREKGERTGTHAMTQQAKHVTCFSDMRIRNTLKLLFKAVSCLTRLMCQKTRE